MPLPLLFWILMLLWFVFGAFDAAKTKDWRAAGGGLVLFLILLVLGTAVFGGPVK